MMKHYQVYACLEGTIEVDAESEEDAFIQASDALMYGGDWQHDVTCLDSDDEEEYDDEEDSY